MSEEFDGESLRNWRKQRGIKREDIAKACHVSVVAVHNWENGRNKPHAAIIPIIEGMMNGEIAVIPLTGIEELYLDAAVERGRFQNREDFLAAALRKVVERVVTPTDAYQTGSSSAPYPITPLPQSLKVADADPDSQPGNGPSSATAPIVPPGTGSRSANG